MDMIAVGTKAPDFTLEDQHGNKVSLSQFKGKKVLLSWHPLAWTSVCTDQMRALEANKDKFAALNTQALGFSVDSMHSKAAWAAVLAIKDTPILADFWPHGKVAKDYGLFLDDAGISGRYNILIDEQGTVVWTKEYAIPQLPDLDEVLKAIAKH